MLSKCTHKMINLVYCAVYLHMTVQCRKRDTPPKRWLCSITNNLRLIPTTTMWWQQVFAYFTGMVITLWYLFLVFHCFCFPLIYSLIRFILRPGSRPQPLPTVLQLFWHDLYYNVTRKYLQWIHTVVRSLRGLEKLN